MRERRSRRTMTRLWLAQGLDGGTFVAFYALAGPAVHAERNPIIAAVATLGGVWAVLAAKMIVVGIIDLRSRQRRPWSNRRLVPVRVVALSAATASGIVGAGFNIAAIVDTARRMG